MTWLWPLLLCLLNYDIEAWKCKEVASEVQTSSTARQDWFGGLSGVVASLPFFSAPSHQKPELKLRYVGMRTRVSCGRTM